MGESTISISSIQAEMLPSTLLFAVLTAEEPATPATSKRLVLDRSTEVDIRRGAAWQVQRAPGRLVMTVPDRRLSAPHARVHHDGEQWLVDDQHSKNGVFVNGARIRRVRLRDGDVIELGYSFFVFRHGQPATGGRMEDLDAADVASAPAGLSSIHPSLEATFAELARLAVTDVTVLVTGETGTGKELIARAVHTLSGRRGPLVAVNCAALPRTLLESELFGFKKGSFSGALRDHPGLVVASHTGSLFLDEIGELPLDAQAALLRVLQEREVLPIGSTQARAVDLRLLAATNLDLQLAVTNARFRADLLARLGGITISLPPVRERREDLGILVSSLLGRIAPGRPRLALTHLAARSLFSRAWPGNVRELERALELAVALAHGDSIDLAPSTPGPAQSQPTMPSPADNPDDHRAQLELLLDENRGNVTAIARKLGKDRRQIYRWIERTGIDLTRYR
jgi:DNA-binding NtrC family response regulator